MVLVSPAPGPDGEAGGLSSEVFLRARAAIQRSRETVLAARALRQGRYHPRGSDTATAPSVVSGAADPALTPLNAVSPPAPLRVSGGIQSLERVADRASKILGTRVSLAVEGHPGEDGAALAVPVDCSGRQVNLLVHDIASGQGVAARLAGKVLELIAGEMDHPTRPATSEELRNHFIRELVLGRVADEAEVRRESHILGLDLARARSVILIDAAEYILTEGTAPRSPRPAPSQPAAIRSRDVIAAVVRFFRLPDETICAYTGEGEVVVLKASTSRDLASWSGSPEHSPASWANLEALKRAATGLQRDLTAQLRTRTDVAIGRYHPGVAGLAASYEDSRLALQLGRTNGHRVHSLDEIGLPALVAVGNSRIARSLAGRLLRPLEREPELRTTLCVFLRNDCSVRDTAGELSIHRNTLGYRLEKVASLTGLDPRRFNDAVQIRVALELLEQSADESGDQGRAAG